jgi:rare lipoprotein A
VLAAGAVLAVAALAALAPSGAVAAGGDGGDIAGGLADIGVADGAASDPATQPTDDQQGASTDPGLDEPSTDGAALEVEDRPVTGATAQIELQRARLVATRNRLQRDLLVQEEARRGAEDRRDAALQAIAARLVALYQSGDDARVEAIIAVRDETDETLRAGAIAALEPADRALFGEYDRADGAVEAAARVAEATRAQVLDIGTRLVAIDAALDDRKAPTKAERERQRGDRYTIDADYVFATGPIPSIGYWGAMGGGGLLTGWMGYAGAAVGGIGCDPPQANLQPTGQVESGEASWYGPGFQGNGTANGETFDTNQLTAAHKTLPFGSIVRVYSSATARCVFVRINDRGPYVDGRIIDLSRAAADAIGMESVAPVQLEVYVPAG